MKRAREYVERQREYMKRADSEYVPYYVLVDLISIYSLQMQEESKTIEEALELDDDLFLVMSTLAKAWRTRKKVGLSGRQLQESTGLSPNAINFAVTLLQYWGFVEWEWLLGREYPFVFRSTCITPSRTVFLAVEKAERKRKMRQKKTKCVRAPLNSKVKFGLGAKEY